MERTLLKKKSAIFMAIPLILCKIMGFVRMGITPLAQSGEFDLQKEKVHTLIDSGLYLGQTILTLLLVILFGYLLTKDKKKTVKFTGAAFFGSHFAALFTKFVTEICDILVNVGNLDTELATTISQVASVLSLPVAVYFADFAFTAFEGINSKIKNSPLSMTVSQAKKRFIVCYVAVLAVPWILGSIPGFILSFSDGSTEFNYAVAAINDVVEWLITVLAFAIFYFAGYKKSKSHLEAMSFYAAGVSLVAPVTDIFSSIVNVISNGLYLALSPVIPADADFSNMTPAEAGYDIRSIITSVSSVVVLVGTIIITVAIAFAAIKFFFAKKAEAIEVEEAAEAEENVEE